MKNFNINSMVKVKLNPLGIRILEARNEELKKMHPNFKDEFKLPITDENGYTEFQLWNLMATFGPYMGPGFNPFETNIVLNDEYLFDISNESQKKKVK